MVCTCKKFKKEKINTKHKKREVKTGRGSEEESKEGKKEEMRRQWWGGGEATPKYATLVYRLFWIKIVGVAAVEDSLPLLSALLKEEIHLPCESYPPCTRSKGHPYQQRWEMKGQQGFVHELCLVSSLISSPHTQSQSSWIYFLFI